MGLQIIAAWSDRMRIVEKQLLPILSCKRTQSPSCTSLETFKLGLSVCYLWEKLTFKFIEWLFECLKIKSNPACLLSVGYLEPEKNQERNNEMALD